MRERQLTPTLKWRALAVILSAVLILGAATLSLHAQPPAAAPNPDFVHAIWVVKADGVLKLAGADGNLLFQITNAQRHGELRSTRSAAPYGYSPNRACVSMVSTGSFASVYP